VRGGEGASQLFALPPVPPGILLAMLFEVGRFYPILKQPTQGGTSTEGEGEKGCFGHRPFFAKAITSRLASR
jgi:hypothetical protein